MGKRKGANGVGGARKDLDFTYFRLGEVDGDVVNDGSATSLAQAAAERSQIAAKLSALQLPRRKAKQDRQQPGSSLSSRRPSSAGGHAYQNRDSDAAETSVVIGWRHLAKSLESTRSSVSAQERRQLERVYREFVVGRNGEMSDGQGGTEVGGGARGRTSLM